MALNPTTVTKTEGGSSWTGEEDGKEGEAYGGNNVIETKRGILKCMRAETCCLEKIEEMRE